MLSIPQYHWAGDLDQGHLRQGSRGPAFLRHSLAELEVIRGDDGEKRQDGGESVGSGTRAGQMFPDHETTLSTDGHDDGCIATSRRLDPDASDRCIVSLGDGGEGPVGAAAAY